MYQYVWMNNFRSTNIFLEHKHALIPHGIKIEQEIGLPYEEGIGRHPTHIWD